MKPTSFIFLGCILCTLILLEQAESYSSLAQTLNTQRNTALRRSSSPTLAEVGKVPGIGRTLNTPRNVATGRLSSPTVAKMPKHVESINRLRDRPSIPLRNIPTPEGIGKIIKSAKKNPEVYMNATRLATSKGYPFEEYEVITEDGYILGLFRIPHGVKNKDKEGPRPVVLLQHGIVGSADDWLVNPTNQSLGFLLADAGADVWLANNRGNRYSRRHVNLDPDDKEFWKFSLDEMAKYDIPAEVNFILEKTGQEQLYYCGYSQGTTLGFAAFSENPELQSKIKHFLALAPLARVRDTISTLRFLVPLASTITEFSEAYGIGEFKTDEAQMKFFASYFAQDWGAEICKNFLFLMCGFNKASLNTSRIDVYLSHVPAGTSARTVLHWAQGIESGYLRHFDYGDEENNERYLKDEPPEYDLKKVTVPVAVFRGGQDWLAVKTDVNWLLRQLKVSEDIYVPFYEHLDLIYGTDAADLVYKPLIKIIMGDQQEEEHNKLPEPN